MDVFFFPLKLKLKCEASNQVRYLVSASAAEILARGEEKKKKLLMSVPFLVPKMDSRPSPLLPSVSSLAPQVSRLEQTREEGGRKGRGGPACHVTPRGANVRS